MISKRSQISLAQFLALFRNNELRLLLEKHNMALPITTSIRWHSSAEQVREALYSATEQYIFSLLDEILRTQGYLRSKISPRYSFDERWDDLVRCLSLDGYIIKKNQIIRVEPSIEGRENLEDDLTTELRRSDLAGKGEIVRVLDNSANDFKKTPPDYNACLTNARTALLTIAKQIALSAKLTLEKNFDAEKWGALLAYLKSADFINQREEKGLTGVFTFISPGAHEPIGLEEEEFTRLGRNMAVSMCYFLIKKYRSL